jgi:P-type Ca2+ transporter type 2C
MVSPVNLNATAGLSEQDANGLSSATAIATLERDGYNELPSAQSRSLLAIAWDSIQDPIFLLLVVGGVIYWILGDLQEALILLGFVVFIMGISLYQKGKTEHAMEALHDLSSLRDLVIRDGEQTDCRREVVRSDKSLLF